MNRDHDHLRLLGLFLYIRAGMMACSTSLGVVYIGFFATMMPIAMAEVEAEAQRQRAAAKQAEEAAEEAAEVSADEQELTEAEESSSSSPAGPPGTQTGQSPFADGPPEAMFSMISTMLYGMGAFMLVFGFAMAFANVYAARCLAQRKHRTFCLLTAGFNCLHAPLGLILGVCTFLVLLRPTVEDLFDGVLPDDGTIIDADIVE
ncbi:MAG: hypothetical protein H8E66_10485 [Planctomycetes bacterium]|nr:hypothetical protein [Planctomycetota bacterium]